MKSECSSPYHVTASSKKQVLSSDVTLSSGCGSEAAPWVIQGKPGQQIEVSLIDFYWDDKIGDNKNNQDTCAIEYGYIVDGETSNMATICGGSKRTKHLQVSAGDMIQVVIKHDIVDEYRFILEYSGWCQFSAILFR